MKWTQDELEKLYQEVNAKAVADSAFREALMGDTKGTLEKIAGCKLPDDFNLKFIESDKGYAATYIVPDFVQGELNIQEMQDDDLSSVAGGISIALIVSISGDSGCLADTCYGNECGSFNPAPNIGGCMAYVLSPDFGNTAVCNTYSCGAYA